MTWAGNFYRSAIGKKAVMALTGIILFGFVLVHMIAETHRHAGHADIVRELIDGAAGLLEGNHNLPPGDAAWWAGHCDRIEAAARLAGDG